MIHAEDERYRAAMLRGAAYALTIKPNKARLNLES